MVEIEPVLLPQSTSPKTLIWVSQARPCQEQPALFGSLERLPGQTAPNNHSKAPHHATAHKSHTQALTSCTGVEENLPEALLSSKSVTVNHSHCFLDNILVHVFLAFPLHLPDIPGEWRRLSCLQFFNSQSAHDAKWNIQVSWSVLWDRSCANQGKSMFAGSENRSQLTSTF